MTENLPPLSEELLEILEPPLDRPEDIARIYGWADVLILLSSFEGLPLTVLEAQRMGVVVIATDVGALRDVVQDGENGVLLPLDQAVPGAIAALMRLAVDHDWRKHLSERAFATQPAHSWPEATTALAAWLDRMTPQA
jgi:glycosyltransferase involved in cell wall biosynthesis